MATGSQDGSSTQTLAEMSARLLPPAGFEDCAVVRIGQHRVWKPFDDLADDDIVCWYDGDCSAVLKPDDPRIRA